MSFIAPANDPLPYRPIKIIDISPYRASIRSRPAPAAARRRRGDRQAAAALVAALFAAVLVVATAGAAPADQPQSFQLGPGHAMPASLAD